MGKLAELLEQATSNDRFVVYTKTEQGEDNLERRKKAESGPVKETLDLNQFTRFNIKSSKYRGRSGVWLSVDTRGDVGISHEIGKNYQPGTTVEFFLNKKGTILVMRPASDGIPMRNYCRKSGAKKCCCKALRNTLRDLGVELPVRFWARWDEQLQAWVGRR